MNLFARIEMQMCENYTRTRGREAGMDWEPGLTCIHQHVKQLASWNSLQSTGRPALQMDSRRVARVREDVYIEIADKLYCTVESNKTLVKQLYSNLKNNAEINFKRMCCLGFY